MPLPEMFCWTRMGSEAGEDIDHILARKERERAQNEGVFLWGIGNAVGPSLRELIRIKPVPEIIFSLIRSAPRQIDVAPPSVVRWLAGEALDGTRYKLSASLVVTSREKAVVGGGTHYALVCRSANPLEIDTSGDIVILRRLRNILTGRHVGASQVTAIVRQGESECECNSASYRAVLRAHLVFPYLIHLRECITLTVMNNIFCGA